MEGRLNSIQKIMEPDHKGYNAGLKGMEEMMELFTDWIGEQVNQTQIYKFKHGHIKDKIVYVCLDRKSTRLNSSHSSPSRMPSSA